MKPSKGLRHYLPRLALAATTTTLALLAIFSLWWSAIRPEAMRYAALRLSDEERDQIYQEITNQSGALWDVSPEPWVGRLGKKGLVATYGKEEVRFNNAGLRSSRDFGPKRRGKFRIVCLGDSFVFANAAPEQDRFCDQIGDFYDQQQVRVDGKDVETYAVGLSGWTMVQEAAYLSHRLSEYQPDVIIVLTVSNDITCSQGVTGGGMMSDRFSPEERQMGSGVFSAHTALQFGVMGYGAISTDLTPQPRARWAKSMKSLKRLADLQHQRGGKILLSTLEPNLKPIYFSEIFKHHACRIGIKAPLLTTSFFGFRLPHDSHPDRTGHGILASHYIHMLDRLGWVRSEALPELHQGLQVQSAQPDTGRLRELRRNYIQAVLRSRLAFDRLEGNSPQSFLGGILPQRHGGQLRGQYPWASVRSGFLLKRPKNVKAGRVVVQIEIPARLELFPMQIRMKVNGRPLRPYRFQSVEDAGPAVLESPLDHLKDQDHAVEVILETDSYFATIPDSRMKSFQLVSAQTVSGS